MTKKIILTLTIITKGEQILLGYKKTGFGMGNYNGFGGKVEEGETISEAAAREVFQECSLAVIKLKPVAIIDFSYAAQDLLYEIHVFKTSTFSGSEEESVEMKPEWFKISQIPYKKMWVDDQYWLPLVLANKKVRARFVLDKKNRLLEKEVNIVTELD